LNASYKGAPYSADDGPLKSGVVIFASMFVMSATIDLVGSELPHCAAMSLMA
jgi:hypothetical protein